MKAAIGKILVIFGFILGFFVWFGIGLFSEWDPRMGMWNYLMGIFGALITVNLRLFFALLLPPLVPLSLICLGSVLLKNDHPEPDKIQRYREKAMKKAMKREKSKINPVSKTVSPQPTPANKSDL